MKQTTRFLFTLITLCISTNSLALKSDRDQPAEIQADNTEIDFKSGVRTLTNNVLVEQGTLRLKADKLVAIYNKKGDLTKATAWGSLARFKQRPDNEPDDVEGWGKKMVVDYKANTLTLIGSAALKKAGSTARGNTIVYNMATDKLSILGDSNLKTLGKSNQPKKKIADPFKDNHLGPDSSVSSNLEQTKKIEDQKVDQLESTITPSGRSRLIIQPKLLKK